MTQADAGPAAPSDSIKRCIELAERIDTSPGDDKTDRALIVFNTAPPNGSPLEGLVSYNVSMSWRVGRDLPPVVFECIADGRSCPAFQANQRFVALTDGSGYGALEVELWWRIAPIPPGGWDSYRASYRPADTHPPLPELEQRPADQPAACYVVERRCRAGDLPPTFSPPD